MSTAQPVWKCIANLGDANPVDHGGYFVLVDTTGVYPPEAVLLDAPDEDPVLESTKAWTTHRFILEPCTDVDGILSDNPYHPECAAWFVDGLDDCARYVGRSTTELRALFCSEDPIDRAQAWRDVVSYWGAEELDQEPDRWTRAEAEARYGPWAQAGRS